MRILCASILALLPLSFAAQPPAAFRKATFEEMPAVILANDKMELTVLTRGGALVNLILADDPGKLSPLWNPIRMARELGQKSIFGSSLGHFVCVDGFGPVSSEERAAGLPGHGEAHMQPWDVKSGGREGATRTVTFATRLPLVDEGFTRSLRMVDGENVVYVETELESRLPFDRPVCWAEHATIGSPFLSAGVTAVDMPAKRARTRPYEEEKGGGLEHRLASGKDFTWPLAPAVHGRRIDVRVAPKEGGTGDHTTCLMDPSSPFAWVTALNPERRLILGYIWKQSDYPWVQNWENYPKTMKWARGLEFGTQPFDVPRREVIQLNSLFDSPVYRWLPAKSKIGTRFLLFYAHAPEGFRKVDDVRLERGQITVRDKKSGKQIALRASLPL